MSHENELRLYTAFGSPKKWNPKAIRDDAGFFACSKSVSMMRTHSEGVVVALPDLRQTGSFASTSSSMRRTRSRQLAPSLSDGGLKPVRQLASAGSSPPPRRAPIPRMRQTHDGASFRDAAFGGERASLKLAQTYGGQTGRRRTAKNMAFPAFASSSGFQSSLNSKRRDATPRDVSSALKQISSVAVQISADLGQVPTVYDASVDRNGDYAGDIEPLRLISSIGKQVRDNLNGGVPFSASTLPSSTTSRTGMAASDKDSSETPLRVISEANRRVFEEMGMLQEVRWASAVLSSVPKNDDEEELPSQQEAPLDEPDTSTNPTVTFQRVSDASEPVAPLVAADEDEFESSTDEEELADERPGSSSKKECVRISMITTGTQSMDPSSETETTQHDTDAAQQIIKRRKTNMGFTADELVPLHAAFNRFKGVGSSEVHVDDMPGLLGYLGHVLTEDEAIKKLCSQITEYRYLEFDEVEEFMKIYIKYEREEFQRMFTVYDRDNSGEINLLELRQLMSELGFIPMNFMVQEALESVDKDHDEALNFEELCILLTVYRDSEAFSRAEWSELRRVFGLMSVANTSAVEGGDFHDEGPVLPASRLREALVRVFGALIKDAANEFQEKLLSGQGLSKSADSGRMQNFIHFKEFLIFARKVREAEFERLQQDFDSRIGAFHLFGKKGHSQGKATREGGIAEAELRDVVDSLGYTPLIHNIREVCEEVLFKGTGPWTDESEMDFNQLFDFMMIFYKREGFRKSEIQEMAVIFGRFDADDSGKMSIMELSECFRYLGYRATLDEIHETVGKVTTSADHIELDFREFVRVMRLYREKQLRIMRGIFDDRKSGNSNCMPGDQLEEAVQVLGYDRHNVDDINIRLQVLETHALDFDAFVGLIDALRATVVERERKKAGFSDAEIDRFKEVYNGFDIDGNGEIEGKEMLGLLRTFGWEPKNRTEQTAIMGKLDAARAAARAAGIPNVGQDGRMSTTFWPFIQLARTLQTEFDKADEEELIRLEDELKFTQKEAEEFRQIFRTWYEKEIGRPSSLRVLPNEAVKRLLRSLGVTIWPDSMRDLDHKLQELSSLSTEPGSGGLEFHGFLRLMRWLVDTDFGGVRQGVEGDA